MNNIEISLNHLILTLTVLYLFLNINANDIKLNPIPQTGLDKV